MYQVLKKFNVGDQFINWVKLLYKNTKVSLNINGELTQPFYPTRGVKQGDPLSSMLFVLTIEPLAQLLRNHPERGFAFSNSEGGIASVLLFADHTTLVSGSVIDLEAQLEIVDEFCRYSGAKLNRSKSKVLTLDSNQQVIQHPRLNMISSGTPVKYLGIHLGHNLDPNLQIKTITDKFYKSFTTWACRARTIR
ncbi:hypothetical protein AeRB84_008393, partial [Aphanomyces euteiches]